MPPEVRHSTLVYFFDFDPVHCRPRWTNYDVLHEDIAEESDMSPHDVSRIHVVGHPPNDLKMANIYPVIAQQPQDISEGSTFQMILLDVEFHNALPSLDPEVVRRVKLLPMTVSRKALFAILGLQPYCNYAKKQCLLWHNRNPVKVQQRALLDLRHGDYVRIAVPPARGELRKYYTREVAQCFRRGYRASNIPVLLEAYPAGFPVEDMPVYDTFSYVPRAEDLDYDRDALALFQIESFSIPPFDPWPVFLKRCAKFEAGSFEMKAGRMIVWIHPVLRRTNIVLSKFHPLMIRLCSALEMKQAFCKICGLSGNTLLRLKLKKKAEFVCADVVCRS